MQHAIDILTGIRLYKNIFMRDEWMTENCFSSQDKFQTMLLLMEAFEFDIKHNLSHYLCKLKD